MSPRLKSYMPAIVSLVSALLMVLFPVLAAIVLVPLLTVFGLSYASVIRALHRSSSGIEWSEQGGAHPEEGFRTVTVEILRKGRII